MSEDPEIIAEPTLEIVSKRGRGRPRKTEVEISERPVEQTSIIVPKRGRGRPRKVQVQPEITAAEHISDIPSKRGRGRPRKSEKLREIIPPPLLEIKKKRRGRPALPLKNNLSHLQRKNKINSLKKQLTKRKSRNDKIIRFCAVSSCQNSSKDPGPKRDFFLLPNDARRSTWMYLAGIMSVSNKRTYICDRHFQKDDYYHTKNTNIQKQLKHNAVPTMHLETQEPLELNEDVFNDLLINPSKITVKLHETIKMLSLFKKKNPFKYADLQLSFYLKHSSAYKLVEKPLHFLSPLELKEELYASPINFVRFSNLINKKLLMMEDESRECFVTCVQIAIERKIYYSPKSDKIIGLSMYKSRPADSVIILMAHGINSEWQIPLDMTINIFNHKHLAKNWIEQTVKIYKMLRVNGFVWLPNYADYMNNRRFFETIKMDFRNQFCHVFYDLPFLLKMLYYNLKLSNYCFGEFSAKLDDLKKLYEIDSKRVYPLAPNLSANSVNLTTFDQLMYEHIKEVFCDDTAAALRTYTEVKLIKAEGTAIFIENINSLIKLFDPNVKLTNEEKESIVFKVQEFLNTINNDRINHFVDDLTLIMDIYIEDPDFFNNISKYLLNNSIHKFVDNILVNSIGEKPTGIDVENVFRKSNIDNVLKPIKKNVSFDEALNLVQDELSADLVCLLKTNEKGTFELKPSDYKLYMLEREDRILYVSGYILKKCLSYHKCNLLTQYINSFTEDDKLLSESIQKDIDEFKCSIIKNDFVEFIESLEMIFLSQFPKFSTKDFLVQNLLKLTEIQALNFTKACPCFPLTYAKELFVRIRIDYVLSYNNMNDAKSTLLQNISL